MRDALNSSLQPSLPSTAPAPPADMMPDWGIGHYQRFAPDIEPAAARVTELARIGPGEQVLDIASGTGNAALLAASRGAVVTGLDRSPRLIEVARDRAAADGAAASFVVGDAQALPFEDARFDVVISVFGVIFAADPRRAVSELLRVLRPQGRALICAWMPGGAIDAMIGVITGAVRAAIGIDSPRFPWHDPSAVDALAAPVGSAEQLCEGEIVFSGDSPERYLQAQEADHPMSIAARELLQHVGTYEAVRRQAVAALRDGNEDGRRFRATSRYRVIGLHRTSAQSHRSS
jgi:SAM-dependent methyltransferase